MSERTFLRFSIKSKALTDFLPSVLRFRADAAAAIAPEFCPPLLSLTVEGGRIEFLTDYFKPVPASADNASQLETLFDPLIRTLSRFEDYDFYVSDLFPGAFAINETGGAVMLPVAYVIPPLPGGGASSSVQARPGIPGTRLRTPLLQSEGETIHLSLLERLIRQISARTDDAPFDDLGLPPFCRRLQETAGAIAAGKVTTLGGAYEQLFQRPLQRADTRRWADESPAIKDCVNQVVERARVSGSVVVVKGDSYTGKSRILQRAAVRLQRSEACSVTVMDEWDLFAARRKRSAAEGKSPSHRVWVIDDIDEREFASSDFSTALLDSSAASGDSVILGVRSNGLVQELSEFLDKLRRKSADGYLEIDLEGHSAQDETGRLAGYLCKTLRDLGGKPCDTDPPGELIKACLERLRTEERQLLEFIAVARFAMPLDLVMSVFSESNETIGAAILRLVALGSVELSYRKLPRKSSISLFVRIESVALRHLIYGSIPKSRRKKLHRTVILIGERERFFPNFFLLLHALWSGDNDLSARHALAYLRDTKSERRNPAVVSLCIGLAGKRILESLPFADQVLAHYELALDLLQKGSAADAERLLLESRDLIDEAEEDVKLKNAPRLSGTYRLLADRWEARGEFKQALDLLETARDDLRSALPIPEQAQLLNDIGWLQYRLGDYDMSMESSRLSLNTLSATQYPMIVAQALNLMGVVHFNTSRYDEAISYYEQSAYLRERSGDDNSLAASFNNLALAYQSKGEYEKALDYYNRSLELKRRQNNQAGIAGGYLNLALLYLEGRNFKEAEAKCRESLAISEALENAPLAADNYATLGDIALEDGDFEAAEQHYRVSLNVSHERQAINEEMGALRRLSAMCLKQKRFEEAKEFADAAFELVQRIGSKYENAQIEVIFGDLEREQNRQVEALKHYERASTQYTALSKYRLAATVLAKIGLIHAQTGNDLEARHYLDRAQDFIRADIGRELPEEFVKLQHVLRAHPARTPIGGKESQELLMAFYELSALTDYATDHREFIRRVMDAARRVVDPTDCYLALRTDSNQFRVFGSTGERSAALPRSTDALFRRTLLLGGLVDSHSQDLSDVVPDLDPPEGQGFLCIPLKAMSEDLGCLLFYLEKNRLPLSKENVNFFTWLGRQVAGSLKLMLHLNEQFLKGEILEIQDDEMQDDEQVKFRFESLIGKSEAMKDIFRLLEKVKNTDSGILILGESGTGKSVLARAIHYKSPRHKKRFQEIHCAQIPHDLLESELFGHERGSFTGAVRRKLGLCEMADGGTLFLDDINVMPIETQTKLLHFIDGKSFMRLGGNQRLTADVRIVAASNEDLEELCKQGKFRLDLYYRLKVILIDLPPLRERKEDMLAIALDYVKKSCAEKGIPPKTLSPEAIQLFQKATWGGNVRELQNVLERVIVLSDDNLITSSSLPDDFLKEVMGTGRHTSRRLDELVDQIIALGNYSESKPLLPVLEALLARRMVSHVDGKGRAAAMLGISKPTLYARLRDYDRLQ
ncbi:MAG: sigma 54-interacting transcriptional regulator [Candidatus Krumholzibacteria bacterium]